MEILIWLTFFFRVQSFAFLLCHICIVYVAFVHCLPGSKSYTNKTVIVELSINSYYISGNCRLGKWINRRCSEYSWCWKT